MAFNNTPKAVHVDEYLTSFAINYAKEYNAIAPALFPTLDVSKQSDKYWVFSAEDANREFTGAVTKAVPRTKPNNIDVTQSDDSYFAELFWLGFDMDEQTEANEDEVLRTRERKAKLVMDNMLKKRDRDFLDTFVKAGVWGEDLVGGTDFTVWSDGASTPIDDVMKWKEDFSDRNYGLEANKIMIAQDVKRFLLSNTQILGRINGGASIANPAMVNDALIASIFEVDEIIWAKGHTNKAEYGQAENRQKMVSNQMLMVHSPSDAGMDTPASGMIFSYNAVPGYSLGITMESFTGPHLAAQGLTEEVQAKMAYDMKVTGASLGTYVGGLVTL